MEKAISVSVLVVMLGLIVPNGFGSIYLQGGGTYNINSTVNEVVEVDLIASNSPTTVNIVDGGLIKVHAYTYNNSRLNLIGGTIENHLFAKGSSYIDVKSGIIGDCLYCEDNSNVRVMGGTLRGGIYLEEAGRLYWAGGTIVGRPIMVTNQSELTISGFNFAINGIPVNYGQIISLSGAIADEPFRTLTGTLTNGELINNEFKIGDNAKIVLIPEPCTLLMLGVGGMLIRCRK